MPVDKNTRQDAMRLHGQCKKRRGTHKAKNYVHMAHSQSSTDVHLDGAHESRVAIPSTPAAWLAPPAARNCNVNWRSARRSAQSCIARRSSLGRGGPRGASGRATIALIMHASPE
mmetsp:Transcript_61701/g.171021  ORF Transcript_61701/g.171021 Transcript_61701/m.171021 type:complete len:115 (-) Transcript_61701:1404-1748(-)